jgi:DNA-binding transcriptional ArsR family regulator
MTETTDAHADTTARPTMTDTLIAGRAPMPDARPRRVTNAQLEAAAASFDMLSVPGRLHLVWLLAAGEYDVTTLAELTGVNVPAASQQLAKLRAAGIVTARRDGRRQLYRVEDPHILTVIEQMFSHIAPDGTLTRDPLPDPRRPPRRPRFSTTRS